ncbi:protein of unknown function [Legionella pneumophila subsp. pneumophila]|uniref:Uncharacterized protein n=1 Tax=Legionella pneumophila subsp. pneumophila TaxID=91891 RepID=A0AAV2UXQ7_LEGPN|nr:protein of unknown function [Legionella pneumophila subsp. pneumophila]
MRVQQNELLILVNVIRLNRTTCLPTTKLHLVMEALSGSLTTLYRYFGVEPIITNGLRYMRY